MDIQIENKPFPTLRRSRRGTRDSSVEPLRRIVAPDRIHIRSQFLVVRRTVKTRKLPDTSFPRSGQPGVRAAALLRSLHEGAQRGHYPIWRFFGQEVSAILALVQFKVRQLGFPPFEFLLSKRYIFEPPEYERGFSVNAARLSQIDRSQSVAPTIYPGSAAHAARASGVGRALR